jgi:ceramide glucosyltransferase
MDWYFYVALAAVVSQILFLVQTFNNHRYVLGKHGRKRPWHGFKVVTIIPCKGLDPAFDENITSFFNQDYGNYLLWFVVESESDPAYGRLCGLKESLSGNSKAMDVRIFVAGRAKERSQKIHNLLCCYRQLADDVDVMAFADSDICVREDWLSHLVWRLRKPTIGATTGYRWFVPEKNNLASLALSAINAKVAQLLGNTIFNQAWGGSMAIRTETFRRVKLDQIWPKALSDDLSLTYAVKKAGLKIEFVPACLVASYESTTWRGLFEFGRRQFLITRVTRPWTWLFGLSGSLYSVLGIWATAGAAIYAAYAGDKRLPFFAAVPVVFLLSQLLRAVLRQRMIGRLLEKDLPKMKSACIADILGFWAWSMVLLFLIISSAFGRTICWRGIRYRMLGPTETVVDGPKTR